MGMKSLWVNYNFIPWYAMGILLSTSYVTTDPFQPVSSSCVYWDFLALYSNGDPEKLHCIVDEKGQLGIVNVRWKWIEQGNCPYYDRYSKQIHVEPCDTEIGSCPDKDFVSFQAVKYSACIESSIREKASLTISNEQTRKGSEKLMIQEAIDRSIILPATNIVLAVLMLITMVGLHIREKLMQRRREYRCSLMKFSENLKHGHLIDKI